MHSLKLIFSNPKYFGAAWVFSSINILFGTWAIYIPSVKENLQIDYYCRAWFCHFLFSLGCFYCISSGFINYQ